MRVIVGNLIFHRNKYNFSIVVIIAKFIPQVNLLLQVRCTRPKRCQLVHIRLVKTKRGLMFAFQSRLPQQANSKHTAAPTTHNNGINKQTVVSAAFRFNLRYSAKSDSDPW